MNLYACSGPNRTLNLVETGLSWVEFECKSTRKEIDVAAEWPPLWPIEADHKFNFFAL